MTTEELRANPDITVVKEGNLYLFGYHTPEAKSWLEEWIAGLQTWTGIWLVVEHRYARDLALGAIEDGLVVV